MKKGWVYVAAMSKRPGMLKIGQSERDPEGRITEWSNETNGDITIECAALVDDPSTHKEMVWQQLIDTGFWTGTSPCQCKAWRSRQYGADRPS